MRLKLLSLALMLLFGVWTGAEVERRTRTPIKPKNKMIRVFYATRALSAGEKIPCRAVGDREIPEGTVPYRAITDFGEAAGGRAVAPIAQGDVLLKQCVAPDRGFGCRMLPRGMRAVSIRVPASGLPGDRVDVHVDTEVFEDVEVLAVGPGSTTLIVTVDQAVMIDKSPGVDLRPACIPMLRISPERLSGVR
ncbi:MAG TPA: SAF domain-containing protein [Isosphaeraceae bacterium]|jgi:Flp pilus assembly protein CpaB